MQASSDAPGPEDLWTVSAAGFSATVDAFARDPESHGLWFLSMVGSQTALKAIWAALLKQPPELAHLARGADGTALSGGYQRCIIPQATVGTWTTKIIRLPATGGYHALVYTKLAQYSLESDSFLLLTGSEADAPALHHRFLDRRSPLPLHRSWADWLWERGIATGEIVHPRVGRHRRLPLPPRRRAATGGPVRGRLVRRGDTLRRRPEPGPDNGRHPWIGRSGRPAAATGAGRSETSPHGRPSAPTAAPVATVPTTVRPTCARPHSRMFYRPATDA